MNNSELDPVPLPIPPAWRPTVKQEWIFLSVISALMMGCIAGDLYTFPSEFREGKKTPLLLLAGIIHAIGCAMWITMDRRRRGREVGLWRFGAIFLGPAIICLYLILEYRGQALFLIPAVVAVYLVTSLVPVLLVMGLQAF